MAAEGTYEYECMRAELLGLEKPDYEEFMINKAEKDAAEDETYDTINLEDAEAKNDSYSRLGGRLDELNSILKSTQRKLNNFKAPGFMSGLFRLKLGGNGPGPSDNIERLDSEDGNKDAIENSPDKQPLVDRGTAVRKTDLSKALDNHVDVLDSLIEKTENAQYSMEAQNKKMKKFLK